LSFLDILIHNINFSESVIRIYTEAASQEKADALALRIIDEIKAVAGI
jgi:phosphomannomutase